MVRRNLYMEKLRKLKDLKLIKVITGVRRSGKSTLLSMFQEELKEENSGHFISLNFEDLAFEHLKDYHKLYEYLLSNIQADRMNYIFDVQLLESVFKFLFDNIGNIVSAKKIADYLTSDGRRTSNTTISNYIQALKDSFILYEANRYDIKGKQQLKSLEKYYLVDISLRNLLIGEQSRDVGRVLENIVYLELIRRGYKVYIGKLDDLEVDFIAQKGEERQYYQVAAGILDENTYEREFAPLRKIKDHFPKFVLTMDHFPMGENGIVQENIVSFLLS